MRRPKAATRLREKAGFDERQATELVATFADGFVENLATKDDVEKLEVSLRGEVERLRGDVEKLETSLRGDMRKMALRTDPEKPIPSPGRRLVNRGMYTAPYVRSEVHAAGSRPEVKAAIPDRSAAKARKASVLPYAA